MKKVFLIILFIIFSTICNASVSVNVLFSDNAVFQQKVKFPVWGTCTENEAITVNFQGQTVKATENNGKWIAYLKSLKPAKNCTLTIYGKENKIVNKNIDVGDVWLCSGQSNMEMLLKNTQTGVLDSEKAIDKSLRLFNVERKTSEVLLDSVSGDWKECNPSSASEFSAVGYYFGENLRNYNKNISVGLINSSRGDSAAEAWMPYESIENNKDFNSIINEERQPSNRVSYLYNAMINPLIPFPIKGVIWYQGENNAWRPYQYREMFGLLISEWRKKWQIGNFPFLYVQLAPNFKYNPLPEESNWAELREAQNFVQKDIKNTAMAVIIDIGDENDYHPKVKKPIGYKLFMAAKNLAYGGKNIYSGPEYKSLKIDEDKIIISFSNVGKGLGTSDGKILTGFTVAGSDKVFYNADSKIINNTVVVYSDKVKEPKYVRYAWANYPIANLINKDGFLASPFRGE